MHSKTIGLLCSLLVAASMEAAGQPIVMPNPPTDSSQAIADRIVNAKKPVLIDFWAVWCGPCRMLTPTIKQLEQEYKGRVEFMKVNVDVHKSISAYFGISAIPAVFIVKDKTVVNGLMGLHPVEEYRAALDSVLALTPKKAPPAAASKPAPKPAPKTTVE